VTENPTMMKYVPSFLSNPHTIAGRTKDLWFKSNSLSLFLPLLWLSDDKDCDYFSTGTNFQNSFSVERPEKAERITFCGYKFVTSTGHPNTTTTSMKYILPSVLRLGWKITIPLWYCEI